MTSSRPVPDAILRHRNRRRRPGVLAPGRRRMPRHGPQRPTGRGGRAGPAGRPRRARSRRAGRPSPAQGPRAGPGGTTSERVEDLHDERHLVRCGLARPCDGVGQLPTGWAPSRHRPARSRSPPRRRPAPARPPSGSSGQAREREADQLGGVTLHPPGPNHHGRLAREHHAEIEVPEPEPGVPASVEDLEHPDAAVIGEHRNGEDRARDVARALRRRPVEAGVGGPRR